MSNNSANEPLLPASSHTRYQSIGSIEPDDQVKKKNKNLEQCNALGLNH